MTKDVWGQELKNGDFIVSASKSSDSMVYGVLKDVDKKTRIRIDKNYQNKWEADDRAYAMYTLERTMKLPDEMIVEQQPELFEVMMKVRESLNVPTNSNVKSLDTLRRLLEASIK